MEIKVAGGRDIEGKRGAMVPGHENTLGECNGAGGLGAGKAVGVAGIGGEDGQGFVGLPGQALDEVLAIDAGEEEDGLFPGGFADGVEIALDLLQLALAGAFAEVAVAARGCFCQLQADAVATEPGERGALPIGLLEGVLPGERSRGEFVGGGECGIGGVEEDRVQIRAEVSGSVAENEPRAYGRRECGKACGGGVGDGRGGGGGEEGGDGMESGWEGE